MNFENDNPAIIISDQNPLTSKLKIPQMSKTSDRKSRLNSEETGQETDPNIEETSSTGIFLAKRKKLFEAQEALERQREIYKQYF